MSKERDEFISLMTKEGMHYQAARRLMREAATLHRLAEAECNGDWPCDNGEREVKPCSRCGMGYVPSTLSKAGLCRSCRAEDRVKAMLPVGFSAIFQGDPRGPVLKLTVPSGYTNDWGNEGVCVPTR